MRHNALTFPCPVKKAACIPLPFVRVLTSFVTRPFKKRSASLPETRMIPKWEISTSPTCPRTRWTSPSGVSYDRGISQPSATPTRAPSFRCCSNNGDFLSNPSCVPVGFSIFVLRLERREKSQPCTSDTHKHYAGLVLIALRSEFWTRKRKSDLKRIPEVRRAR